MSADTDRFARLLDMTRREAFVQGFVAAKDPKSAHDTLVILPDAERAYEEWKRTRTTPT
jgi:hypothetical protein